MRSRASSVAFSAALAAACSTGGPPAPTHCEVEVARLDHYAETTQGPDAGYRVQGVAGSAGTVWLAAKTASGEWIAGYGVTVGPGPFEAVVELSLTGIPERYAAILEVQGKRCKDDAPAPR